ncbi:unnamed protein product [Amoebophrya sp. A25]|nr:unnamed protein product [Amoebophrya sp. A25]|eukprot:GSA25T00010468001.1
MSSFGEQSSNPLRNTLTTLLAAQETLAGTSRGGTSKRKTSSRADEDRTIGEGTSTGGTSRNRISSNNAANNRSGDQQGTLNPVDDVINLTPEDPATPALGHLQLLACPKRTGRKTDGGFVSTRTQSKTRASSSEDAVNSNLIVPADEKSTEAEQPVRKMNTTTITSRASSKEKPATSSRLPRPDGAFTSNANCTFTPNLKTRISKVEKAPGHRRKKREQAVENPEESKALPPEALSFLREVPVYDRRGTLGSSLSPEQRRSEAAQQRTSQISESKIKVMLQQAAPVIAKTPAETKAKNTSLIAQARARNLMRAQAASASSVEEREKTACVRKKKNKKQRDGPKDAGEQAATEQEPPPHIAVRPPREGKHCLSPTSAFVSTFSRGRVSESMLAAGAVHPSDVALQRHSMAQAASRTVSDLRSLTLMRQGLGGRKDAQTGGHWNPDRGPPGGSFSVTYSDGEGRGWRKARKRSLGSPKIDRDVEHSVEFVSDA